MLLRNWVHCVCRIMIQMIAPVLSLFSFPRFSTLFLFSSIAPAKCKLFLLLWMRMKLLMRMRPMMMMIMMWTSFSPNLDSSSSTPSPQQLAHRASSEAVWSDYSLSDICSTHEKPRFKCNCFYLLKGNTLLASSSLGSISTAPIKLRPCKKEKLKTRGQLFESKSCTRLCNTQQVISITESFFTT